MTRLWRAPAVGLLMSLAVFAVAEERGALVRLLPAPSGPLSGRVLFEVLVIDPEPWQVVFLVDGVEAESRKLPPWEAKLRLDSPPREQTVRVELRARDGRTVGSDEMLVNRERTPLRVTIEGLDGLGDSSLAVRARVSLPEPVELESIAVYLNDELKGSHTPEALEDGVLAMGVERPDPRPDDFVRVEARLVDGRSIEDVELVEAAGFRDEVEVRLVQLQVRVTDKRGAPVVDLRREHFRVRDGGELREPAGLFLARDVALLLGLALDSSGSMKPLWPATQNAASSFLRQTVTDIDQGFLVDFDTQLRLVRSRTSSVPDLLAGLEELDPEGGTSLYDSILYSLVQFERQQGRRGLVVLTDGYDANSTSDPKRVIEVGRKLGVPVYILAVEGSVSGRGALGGGRRGSSGLGLAGGGNVHQLRLLTDPTGGRLFRIPSVEHMHRAFAQIHSELRNQYVLTYYTEAPPSPGEPPQVRVEVPGHKGLETHVTFAADQIH